MTLLFNNFHLADSFKGHFMTRHNFIKNTLLMATNDNLHKIQYGNEEPDENGQLSTLNKYNNNIYFIGVLDDETCFGINESLLKQKNRILTDEKIKEKHINLYLQSPGGALLPTLALVDSIKNFEVPVYTYIYGYVGSAATIDQGNLDVSGITSIRSDCNVGVSTASGVVLTSPNGTKYRLIVANDGTLSTTAV